MKPQDFSVAFGQRIKKARIDAGMRQQEFADAAHVSRTTVVSWEAGKRVPGIQYICDIADVLHVDATWLITGRLCEEGTQDISDAQFDEFQKMARKTALNTRKDTKGEQACMSKF